MRNNENPFRQIRLEWIFLLVQGARCNLSHAYLFLCENVATAINGHEYAFLIHKKAIIA